MSRRTRLALPLLLALAACSRGNPGTAAQAPPVAVPGLAPDTLPLSGKLARMDTLLGDALERGPLTARGRASLAGAALIAERALDVAPPFPRLRSGYATSSRLQQIQALADRVLIELHRPGADDDTLRAGIRALRARVTRLRQELAQGGSAAPPPLDSLLARLPRTAPTPAPPPAAGER
jgi:hypothetical protein